MTLETLQGQNFDVLRTSDVVTATGKNILLLPYDRDYAGVSILNYTKAGLAATATAQPYYFRNVKELGNSLYKEQSLEPSPTDADIVQQVVEPGGINIPSLSKAPVVATAITAANPAVVTAADHGVVVGQLIRIVTTDMYELKGAVVKVTAVTDANTFEISVDASGFAAAATFAKMQTIAPLSSHSYKVLDVATQPNSTFTLSNVEGVSVGAVLTIASGNTSLKTVDNKRARVISVDQDSYTVVTDLDTSLLAPYALPTTAGEISASCGLHSIEPDPNIVDGDPYLGGVLLYAGALNPAGESGDLLEIKIL